MYWLPILLLAVSGCAQAQQTAQTRVADDLAECYREPNLLDRNNLPPATIQVLIDIIRKIEDNPNVNMDLRQLSALLLHTYRQDGIEYHVNQNSVASHIVLPFSPTFHSFHRHRLLLTRLIPSNLAALANNTLPSPLKCAIHHMLSTTVDMRLRGDENSCNQLSQYRALRTARSISEDVEILNPMKTGRRGSMKNYDPNEDVEYSSFADTMSERQIAQSTCPLLGGVVNTEWGAVSAGNLIAGIAAGASPQQVPVMQLVRDSTSDLNYKNVQQTVNNLYPATVSGDLAEAILIQGTERGSSVISVGTAGNWNSTQATRYFMLHNTVNIEMTDPEIRGGIDGFVLGSIITPLLSQVGTLRLSTLLDMYYSPVNGVLDPNIRACNRQTLGLTQITDLERETSAFAAALDTNMALRGTIIGGLDALVTSAVSNFQTYTTNNLNDLNCLTTLTVTSDHRTRTNLFIALDSSWQYQAVYPAISYLLDEIEVGKFGSNITLLSALDGSVIINTTNSIADFHTQYTAARHAAIPPGTTLHTSLTNIRQMMQEQLQFESSINYVGGTSSVLLYLINSGNLQNNDIALQQARLLNETVPDLRVLFATSTHQQDTLWSLVRDMNNDIFTISLNNAGTNVDIIMRPVLHRIRSAGRRIVNPLCGSAFNAGSSGTRHFDDFVEPGYINFYSIHPNYFFGTNENRRIRIIRTDGGMGGLTICQSRVLEQPRQNVTEVGMDQSAVTCQSLATTGNVEINLANACYDYWTVNNCPPVYISVQSNTALASFTSAVCTDPNCRFPYNIRYQVQIVELGCFSGASSTTASFLVLLTALYFTLIKE